MAKGASPEPYRSLTLKFKETDNSFPFRPSLCTTISYSVPFVSLSGKACANNKRLLPCKLCLRREEERERVGRGRGGVAERNEDGGMKDKRRREKQRKGTKEREMVQQ